MRRLRFAVAVVCFAPFVVLGGCSGAPESKSGLAYRQQALLASAEQIRLLRERDFILYDPSYREQKKIFGRRLEALASELASIQASGGDVTCATEIYLEANWLNYWPWIIDTTLRISEDPYPYGWLHDGQFTNHNNYDVARILQYGWAHMTASQRRLASDALDRMLAWTLEESLNPDGAFKIDPTFFSSLAADYYFGVSFLDTIGFWDRTKRFWTNIDFPDAAEICVGPTEQHAAFDSRACSESNFASNGKSSAVLPDRNRTHVLNRANQPCQSSSLICSPNFRFAASAYAIECCQRDTTRCSREMEGQLKSSLPISAPERRGALG